MKKIAADKNYRMLKRAQITRDMLAPTALRLAEKDGWINFKKSEETGELLYMKHDMPDSETTAWDLIDKYLEQAKKEYFKNETDKEGGKPSHPINDSHKGTWDAIPSGEMI